MWLVAPQPSELRLSTFCGSMKADLNRISVLPSVPSTMTSFERCTMLAKACSWVSHLPLPHCLNIARRFWPQGIRITDCGGQDEKRRFSSTRYRSGSHSCVLPIQGHGHSQQRRKGGEHSAS